MPFRVDSKNETPKNWSILIALLHEGQLWFIYSGIISPTQWYSTIYVSFIPLSYTILSSKWMNINENTAVATYLRFFYLDKGNVIVKYTFIK